MNPRLILILILLLGPAGGKHKSPLKSLRIPSFPKSPPYIDTFRMEMILDRLHTMTGAIEKINRLGQAHKIPEPYKNAPSIDRVQDSLEAVKGFLSDGKRGEQVENISNTLSEVKKLGDLEELISVAGPLLSMMKKF